MRGGIRLEDIGRRHTPWNERVVDPCTYVSDGEEVLVHVGGRRAVRARVACAAGHHCRVVADGLDCWVHVEDCARPKSVQAG